MNTPNDIALLREALIQARSDFHLISLHGEMRPMWLDAKAGRDKVQDALDRYDARFDTPTQHDDATAEGETCGLCLGHGFTDAQCPVCMKPAPSEQARAEGEA